MAVNKVIYGETTVIDITDSTVTASNLKSGETAYGANGQKVTGTLVVPEVLDDLSDVVITTPQTTQEIYFDGTNWINYGAKIILTFDDDFKGQTITLTKGQTTITKTAPLDSNTMNLYVNETGLWTISSEISGDIYETEVNVTTFGISFDAELSSVPPIPEGATVLPTDDISIWLACANITDKSYTTLAEVLADTETYETLLADSNACQYMKRSTGWAGMSNLVPKMTSNTTPEGTVSYSSQFSGYPWWWAFDGNIAAEHDGMISGTSGYVAYTFTSSKKITKVSFYNRTGVGGIKDFTVDYLDTDGTTWRTVYSGSATQESSKVKQEFVFDNDISSNTWRINILNGQGATNALGLNGLQFHLAGITTSQDAMARLGKFDYASNLLLSDATWAEAIASSDYSDSVISSLVPKMTSNTTPSGEAFESNGYGGSQYAPWRAFDEDTSTYWASYQAVENSAVGYKSTSKVVAYFFDFAWSGSSAYLPPKIQIQGSNDNFVNDINVLGEYTGSDYPTTETKYRLLLESFGSYQYHRCAIIEKGSIPNFQVAELQFYGRTSSEVLIPLVPKMTSDTTPSGECFSSYDNSNAYLVFDGNDSTTFMGSASTATQSFGYDFGEPVFVNKATHLSQSGYGTTNPKIKIQYSDDKSTWQDASEPVSFGASANILTTIIGNINTPHRYWRVYLYGDGGVSSWNTYTVQFYQRTVQTNIVHSSANDTIYYMEDGSPVIVATTNSDGDGVLDFSTLEDKEYTFYSSVAKNPSNLSNDFSKTIRITNTEYGGTTEMYLMPDTVKTLYWWGYENNLEDCSSVNGWSLSGYTYEAVTKQTNYIDLNTSANARYTGIGSKTTVNASELNVVATGKSARNGGYGDTSYYTSKDITYRTGAITINSTNMTRYTASLSGNNYLMSVGYQQNGKAESWIHALWYE